MATQAKVTSTEALESFRASLIVFRGKARKAVDEVTEQVSRTRMWLQQEQRIKWEGEIRRRTKALQQAEQELASARLTGNNESSMMVRQAAVSKMRRSIGEAEDKLKRIKAWNQNYDSRADPLAKRLEGLRQFLDTDIPKSIAYLANAQKILDAYASGPTPSSEPPSPSETPVAPEPGAQP